MSRNWCFTKFGEWGLDKVDLSRVTYLCYQEEVCPKSQRRHYQGYCQLKSTSRVKNAQAILGIGKSHVEPQRGTNAEARAYCMKLESRADPNAVPVEFGQYCEGQGDRTDLKSVVGLPIRTVARDHPELFVRFHRGLIARADWLNNHPEATAWNLVVLENAPMELVPGVAVYYIRRSTRESTDSLGNHRVSYEWHWDNYDYETVAVAQSDPGWTPFVKSIYRGMIVNKVRTLYIK